MFGRLKGALSTISRSVARTVESMRWLGRELRRQEAPAEAMKRQIVMNRAIRQRLMRALKLERRRRCGRPRKMCRRVAACYRTA